MSTLHKLSILASFMVGLGLGACVVPNPDHCFNLATNPNDWCEVMRPDQPFCSPCVAENNGCVASEPSQDECPGYTIPGTDTDTDTDTGESDSTDTDSGESGSTDESGSTG